MNTLGNIIWLIFGRLLIVLAYFLSGVALRITIIGIPFASQHLNLAGLALPFSYKIVENSKNDNT